MPSAGLSVRMLLRYRRTLAIEDQNFRGGKCGHTARPPVAVEELHLDSVGRQQLHDRAYVTNLHVRAYRLFDDGHQIEQRWRS